VAINSSWFLVELTQETVSDINHQVAEGLEYVTLLVLRFNVLRVLEALEAHIDNSDNFVHALCVLDAWVELGVDEENLR
jgi:hypothetical protein